MSLMSFITKRFFATTTKNLAAKVAHSKKIVAKAAPMAAAVLISPALSSIIAKKRVPMKSANPKTHWEAMSVREKNDFLNS